MEIDVLAVHWRSRESFAAIRFNGDWHLGRMRFRKVPLSEAYLKMMRFRCARKHAFSKTSHNSLEGP